MARAAPEHVSWQHHEPVVISGRWTGVRHGQESTDGALVGSVRLTAAVTLSDGRVFPLGSRITIDWPEGAAAILRTWPAEAFDGPGPHLEFVWDGRGALTLNGQPVESLAPARGFFPTPSAHERVAAGARRGAWAATRARWAREGRRPPRT